MTDENKTLPPDENAAPGEGQIDLTSLIAKLRLKMSTWIKNRELEVPSIPKVIAEAMRLAGDPSSTVSEIEKLIEKDQGVAGRLIKIANSVMLRRTRDVDTIREAMVRVGQQELRHTLFSLFMETRLFKSKEYHELASRLWKHSMAVGSVGRRLAGYIKGVDGEVAFLAGLIHDAGKAALIGNIPEEMQDRKKLPEFLIESAMQDIHGLAGGVAADMWSMNEDVIEAVLRHHNPGKAEKNPALAMTVYAADLLVYKFRLGFKEKELSTADDLFRNYTPLSGRYNEVKDIDLLEDPYFQQLGINERIISLIEDDVDYIRQEMENSFSSSAHASKTRQQKKTSPDVVSANKPLEKKKSHAGLWIGIVSAVALLSGVAYLVFSK